ncbi:hypothetical protein BpHYR1_028712 [Brachionus plicatilis]|uniref:Uncharacterized protein n=1 Tax=Brachionus plicatilis TaxID=10195 RepID=A0A3M7PRT0_BRAPC|nr:hypothetical protein BpHYR1_028712 [Brachionus plicatilis]
MPFEHLEDWLRLKWIQQQNVRTSFFFSIWLTNTCCVVCTNTQYCKTDVSVLILKRLSKTIY